MRRSTPAGSRAIRVASRPRCAFRPDHEPPFRCVHRRCYAAEANAEANAEATAPRPQADHKPQSLRIPSEARFNEIGIQHLSSYVHAQIFPGDSEPVPPELIELSKDHLNRHDLLGKNTGGTAPVAFDLPPLHGHTLDEHFYKLGMDSAEPWLTLAKNYVRANAPPKPRKWVRRAGWTKYHADGTTEPVHAPEEAALTFDTEVMYKETSFACMACAVSPTAWYGWLSPWLLGESESDRHLIPLGAPTTPRIVVGHNIGYDRARIAEEYSLEQSKNYFVDTMSLHVAANGMCSRQRPKWVKHRKDRELRDKLASSDEGADLAALLESGRLSDEEEDLWIGRSSVNSLRDVAQFHCNITIDKARREYFGELDRAGICERLDELLDYCAADVEITHRVYQKVFPLFLDTCPHPVSFAALRFLSTEILPVNETWESYIRNAEATYQKLSDGVQQRLVDLAERALEIKNQPEKYRDDPWFSQLDWTIQELRMVKPKKKGEEPRPAKNQRMPGFPAWYKNMFPKVNGPINLTVRTRAAPILLRLCWDGHPLVWSDIHGWTYKVPNDEAWVYDKPGMQCDMSDEENLALRDDRMHKYFKLPHKDGPTARCVNPLAKGYLQYFEQGKLTSEFTYAKEALQMNASCSYWISARDRIMSQMVVYPSETANKDQVLKPVDEEAVSAAPSRLGIILPQLIPMGTITRRAVENTWLTASNAKANRVGSELKSMIRAPPGYTFVGADVDSQELWIASLVGDAQFRLHGGNAIGFMTLEGTKAAGTDMHSRTASILGISRNDAKIFNYGRIYGAGLSFAAQLLRQFNPTLSEPETARIAQELYLATKGKKMTRRPLHPRAFWRGGTESLVFNALETFAEQEKPRTPVLGAGITEALMRRFLSKGGFMTSRINWAIQSSGVDYLHLLIVSMDYLCRAFGIPARLALTVHDEIRYLVREEARYRCALALQVANLWTRAMFAEQMGIRGLPESCAWFSAVDVDGVLRKEVDMPCVTPSNPDPIPPGESLDIHALLDKGHEAALGERRRVVADGSEEPIPQPDRFEYQPRVPVMRGLREALVSEGDAATGGAGEQRALLYLKAQVSTEDAELREVVREAMSLGMRQRLKQQQQQPQQQQGRRGGGGGSEGRDVGTTGVSSSSSSSSSSSKAKAKKSASTTTTTERSRSKKGPSATPSSSSSFSSSSSSSSSSSENKPNTTQEPFPTPASASPSASPSAFASPNRPASNLPQMARLRDVGEVRQHDFQPWSGRGLERRYGSQHGGSFSGGAGRAGGGGGGGPGTSSRPPPPPPPQQQQQHQHHWTGPVGPSPPSSGGSGVASWRGYDDGRVVWRV